MSDLHLKILIVHDISASNLQLLYSKLIETNEFYDYMIVCSPLENIESIVTQFGTICNKVISLQDDSIDEVIGASFININGYKSILNESLYVAGYDEFSTELKDINNVVDDIIDDDMLEDQQIIREQFKINTAENTTEKISNLLSNKSIGNNEIHHLNGIFIFRYKYTHSLNKFLFYPEICNSDSVRLLIIPSDSEESSRLPRTHGNLSILVPKPFNTTRTYYTAIIELGRSDLSVLEIIDNLV